MSLALAQQRDYTIDDIYNLPEGQRAELINGQIYDMAPPSTTHQRICGRLHQAIANYIDSNDGNCEVFSAPFAVFLNEDNKTYVEPDISVICEPDKLTERGCTSAPDWIIEIISPGNPEYDYVRKLNLYLDAGVREYWIVDPRDRKILVYYLKNEHTEDFMVKPYTFQDKIKVNIYDDLWIDFQEMNL